MVGIVEPMAKKRFMLWNKVNCPRLTAGNFMVTGVLNYN